uniref:JmjC domain-containing protein n=1 Tax=Acrobeloides nanus TaxID=290746 RepID=A0A914C2D2_9BILA
MLPSEFTIELIKSTGLSKPMHFAASPSELGMKMPDPELFGVGNVLELIGPDRTIEVVQVKGQKGKTMKLGQFIQYYLTDEVARPDLYNVLSLEFTLTKLADKVIGPAFVKQIDWVEQYWPEELKKRQEVNMAINGKHCSFSTFPKVQRYCLMSVKDCFTDFHVDFGGTSVWYHVLKGRKIFWIIEPTEQNLKLYEHWLKSDSTNKTFFGNIVEKCARVELTAGNTFIIPSGWIHCVFTPQDSLVFGGNFLHNYAIPMQLAIVDSEDNLKIGIKYRYTFFKQMLWYVVERIVREATRRKYLKPIKVNPFNKSQLEALVAYNAVANAKETRSKSNIRHELPDLELFDEHKRDTAKFELVSPGTPSTSNARSMAHHYNRVGMEIEDNETDHPDSVKMEKTEYSTDGTPYEICYDSDNDDDIEFEDPNYRFMPYQTNLSKVNFSTYVPCRHYNETYINSLTKLEKDGLLPLLNYMKQKVLSKSKKIEYPEGITRPHHLVSELEHLVNHIAMLDSRPNSKFDVKSEANQKNSIPPPSEVDKSTLTSPLAIDTSTNLLCNNSPQTSSADSKVIASIDACLNRYSQPQVHLLQEVNEEKVESYEQHKSDSLGNLKIPSDEDTNTDECSQNEQKNDLSSQIMNTDTQLTSPVYDPREDLIPLGKKPLTTAYRKTANMASVPFKKQPTLKIMPAKVSKEVITTMVSVSDSQPNPYTQAPSTSKLSTSGSSRAIVNQTRPPLPSKPSSEFEYKSPLQTYQRSAPSSSALSNTNPSSAVNKPQSILNVNVQPPSKTSPIPSPIRMNHCRNDVTDPQCSRSDTNSSWSMPSNQSYRTYRGNNSVIQTNRQWNSHNRAHQFDKYPNRTNRDDYHSNNYRRLSDGNDNNLNWENDRNRSAFRFHDHDQGYSQQKEEYRNSYDSDPRLQNQSTSWVDPSHMDRSRSDIPGQYNLPGLPRDAISTSNSTNPAVQQQFIQLPLGVNFQGLSGAHLQPATNLIYLMVAPENFNGNPLYAIQQATPVSAIVTVQQQVPGNNVQSWTSYSTIPGNYPAYQTSQSVSSQQSDSNSSNNNYVYYQQPNASGTQQPTTSSSTAQGYGYRASVEKKHSHPKLDTSPFDELDQLSKLAQILDNPPPHPPPAI